MKKPAILCNVHFINNLCDMYLIIMSYMIPIINDIQRNKVVKKE